MKKILTTGCGVLAMSAPALAADESDSASARAEATLQEMLPAEKTILTYGIMPLPVGANPPPVPDGAIPGAGYVSGIPRLGIPALTETDASLGVSYVFGLRKDGATAMPSGLAMASTWNPDLLEQGGRVMGAETRAKGFNVLLAGGVNLMRDPRNGRTFEYLSEDPLLSGVLAGHVIKGIQSQNVISTIKHFALNGQETGRKFVDVKISDAAARESDLLAFKLGIEIGNPGSVMCAYNRVHGKQACESGYLLTKVLKTDWRFKGFTMSDWGSVNTLDASLAGLDQQSGAQLDPQVFFGKPLAEAAKKDERYAARLDDMNRRILWAIYSAGLDKFPVRPGGDIDLSKNSETALEIAKQGIVLLRNNGNALPLSTTAKRVAVIGGYADVGVLSGAGSSQAHGLGGPAIVVPVGGAGAASAFVSQQYHRSSPLAGLKSRMPNSDIRFRDGRFLHDAVEQARRADVAIVFATKWSSEGYDSPDLSLPDGQDQLIEAVAAANPNTIVVLETGNPVAMPWLGKTAAVIQAWFPGIRGGDAIASVLVGETNPSGRLPISYPATLADLPRPKLDGYDDFEPNFAGDPPSPDARIAVDYDIEGSDVGYRWHAREKRKPLFPFGFGLSYTSFKIARLKTDGQEASFTVSNTGNRQGATVGQVYLTRRNEASMLRLVGFQRVELNPGKAAKVKVQIDPRLLADWKDGKWELSRGVYEFSLGEDAETLSNPVSVMLESRSWND